MNWRKALQAVARRYPEPPPRSITMRSYRTKGKGSTNWPWTTVIHPTGFPDAIIERDSCPGYAEWRGRWWADKLGTNLIIDPSFQTALDWWNAQKAKTKR